MRTLPNPEVKELLLYCEAVILRYLEALCYFKLELERSVSLVCKSNTSIIHGISLFQEASLILNSLGGKLQNISQQIFHMQRLHFTVSDESKDYINYT